MADLTEGIMGPGDPAPVGVVNAAGASAFLLIGDHAGIAVPASLAGLGLGADAMAQHIARDIGVLGLGTVLARLLDATFVHQAYSRLVIDCNRDPDLPDAVPQVSDAATIPGNAGLTGQDRRDRIDAIHAPYQQAIGDIIAGRLANARPVVLVSLHSFTPVLAGKVRPWQIGVLHDGGEPAFALAMMRALEARGDLVVGDNEPYRMDATDHTVPRHAYPRQLPYVEIEVRQDLIGDARGQEAWARILSGALQDAWAGV